MELSESYRAYYGTPMLQSEYLNFGACFKKNVLFEQKKLSFETNQAYFWKHV
jgi:hypothetical protein